MAAQQSSCVWRCTVMWSGQYYSLLEIFKEMAHELCPPTSNTWRLPCALRSSMTRVPAGICYKKMKWLMKLSIPSSF